VSVHSDLEVVRTAERETREAIGSELRECGAFVTIRAMHAAKLVGLEGAVRRIVSERHTFAALSPKVAGVLVRQILTEELRVEPAKPAGPVGGIYAP
jgi:hypothetical protein